MPVCCRWRLPPLVCRLRNCLAENGLAARCVCVKSCVELPLEVLLNARIRAVTAFSAVFDGCRRERIKAALPHDFYEGAKLQDISERGSGSGSQTNRRLEQCAFGQHTAAVAVCADGFAGLRFMNECP